MKIEKLDLKDLEANEETNLPADGINMDNPEDEWDNEYTMHWPQRIELPTRLCYGYRYFLVWQTGDKDASLRRVKK